MIANTAIILAGGFGTRLQSVVSDVPKPLAPVNGRPFLAYLLEAIARQGIEHVILAVGYKGDIVEDAIGDRFAGMDIRYSYERTPLGTGGAIQLALKQYNDTAAVWILNGDTYFDCPLAAVAERHARDAADVSLALCHVQQADRYGLVSIDEKHMITAFREKEVGASGLINAGVYLVEPESLHRFDFPEAFSLEKDFFEQHLMDLRLLGSPQPGYFVDIGVPEDYAKAQDYFAHQ